VNACLNDGSLVEAGAFYLATETFNNLKKATVAEIRKNHERDPLSKGIPREALREKVFGYLHQDIFRAVLTALEKNGEIVSEKDTVRIASHATQLSPEQ